MDFGKMTDQFREQANEKIKEELLQKVDEVKADVEKKFGSFGGQTEAKSEPSVGAASGKPTESISGSGTQPENQSTAEESVGQSDEDTVNTNVAEANADQQSDEDENQKVA